MPPDLARHGVGSPLSRKPGEAVTASAVNLRAPEAPAEGFGLPGRSTVPEMHPSLVLCRWALGLPLEDPPAGPRLAPWDTQRHESLGMSSNDERLVSMQCLPAVLSAV